MPFPNSYLRKKRSTLVFIVSPWSMYLIFGARVHRSRALKNKRAFIARVVFKQNARDLTKSLQLIREWYEETNDLELLERLEAAPKGSLPIIQYDSKFILDFNYSTKDIVNEVFEEVIPDL